MENYLIIAEAEEGNYEPIGEAVTPQEARELAASDMVQRCRDLNAGNSPMCPYIYRLWARRSGVYVESQQLKAVELCH
jgi:chorismate-pyruvate lyase